MRMMEYSVKRFARKVLLIHLLLLAALLAVVALASREVYQSARRHTLQQAQQRQTLLAEQTARGVQGFYESILSDLELMHPVNPDDPDSTTPQRLPWKLASPPLPRAMRFRLRFCPSSLKAGCPIYS